MTSDYNVSADAGAPDYEKSPDETIRVPFYWAARLDGETILTTAYELPDGLANEDEVDEDSVQSILISGGSADRTYRITCTVTTSGARTLQQTKRVVVREG